MHLCLRECFRRTSCTAPNRIIYCQLYRNISGAEIASVLRPFYFAVHPDLFGRYPEQRAINEDSLKQLSVHLTTLQHQKLPYNTPTSLPFYVRASESHNKYTFKLINIPLERNKEAKLVLKAILKACNLSTDQIDKIKTVEIKATTKFNRVTETGFGFSQETDADTDNYEESIIFGRIRRTREEQKLMPWLEINLKLAAERSLSLKDLKDDIKRLKEQMEKRLEIKELRYECGWNVEHYRGCLKTLENLANLHEKDVKALKGRIVVFAPFTGVSLDGDICLFTGDVQRNWFDLLQNIPKHDSYLKKIPDYENALSQVLRHIQIKRRKFMPKTHASEYSGHLRKVTTSLLDYLTKSKYPKSWPENLEEYEFVIESESGPLMVSPTGQLIAPSTCPGFILVDFITNHLNEAKNNSINYKKHKYIERELHARCLIELELNSLKKDDSVTPEKMIDCLQRMIVEGMKLKNVDLHITHYYSILADGTVCVPWNWKP